MWEFPAWKFFSLDMLIFASLLPASTLGLGSILYVVKLAFQV